MNKSFFLLLVLLLISCNLFSSEKEFYIQSQAKWIETINYKKTSSQFNSEEGVTYLLVDNQNNVATKERYVHVALKIEEENGIQNNSDLWIDYDPSYHQLFFHKLVVHRKNNDYNRLNREDFKVIQKESDLDSKIYRELYSAGIYIKDVQVGDIIEYSYTIKGDNPIIKGHYFDKYGLQFPSPLNRFFLKIIYPKNKKIHYKTIKSNRKPEKVVEGDNLVLKWDISNIEQVVANSDLPSWYIAFGLVQFSTFDNWEDLTIWISELYPKVDINKTSLEKEITKITGEFITQTEKINALIRFVQEEIRYVGIEVNENSFKPHSPVEVFNNRFGDCKDKSYLLATLLQHMGINAYPALVNTKLRHSITEYIPSPTVFNHVIVAIELENEMVFVDPTLTSQRGDFNFLYNGDYKKALIINSKYKKPVDVNNQSIEKVVIYETFEVGDTISPVKYSVECSYYGSEADQMRSSFRANTQKELRNSYLNFYDRLYPNMRVIGEFEVQDNESDNILHVTENYEIDNFWAFDDSPSINDYVCTVDGTNLEYYISSPKQKNRKMPFSIYHPIEIENKIEYNNSKEIHFPPEEGEINNANFHFSYKISKEGNSIHFSYKYKSLKGFVSTSEMDQYYKDNDKISNLIWNRFTYGKENIKNEMGLNWMMIVLSTFFIIIMSFIAFQLFKRDIGVSNEGVIPMKIGGWLILPAIGLALSPFILIYSIITTGYFELSSWEFISSPDSVAYNSIWSIVFVLELLINTLFVIYSILLLALFFKRRTSFPLLYIFYLLINLTFVIADYSLLSLIESDYFTEDISGFGDIAKASIGTLIWIPYMLKSKRVKNTFVNYYKKRKLEINETI